ncbi:MAG: DEAD/DEAH box helicase family protein [Planctomycetota bacterium]
MTDSPFLRVPETQWVLCNSLAFAIWDRFPVSPGHVLVVTRRVVATWFDADSAEQSAVLELVNAVKQLLDATLEPRPDGYNVGFNSGLSAGQTVMHLHVHVIPRYTGDVADPRGGVRYVIPSKANYLVSPRGELSRGGQQDLPRSSTPKDETLRLSTGYPESPLWEQLSWRIAGARRVDVLASFLQSSGLDVVESALFAALRNAAHIRLIVSDYLCISDPKGLDRLSGWCESASADQLPGTLAARLVESDKLPSKPASFHPKSWYVADEHSGLLSVGSSNLSRPALETGVEWNLLSTSGTPTEAHEQFMAAFERLWEVASPLTPELIEAYTAKAARYRATHFEPESFDIREPLAPRTWQTRAMAALRGIRDAGYQRALVAVATGMGKTWLAAFDARQVGDRLGRRPRVLVVAHRAHILAQAEAAVSQVLDSQFGQARTAWYIGSRNDLAGELVVASIQKLARPEGLERLSAEAFDYVVIDEVHHAHAPSYRRVLARIQSAFILGLTATPERTDGVDVATIFDDNLAYHATIGDGIAEESLVPFHYIGLKDTVDFSQIPWRNGRFELEELEQRVARSERMERLWAAMQEHPADRTILFCCSRRHATFTRDWLRSRGVTAAAVFSGGGDSYGDSLQQLRRGDLSCLCVVDMFNEGLDIPAVDRVVMLRPTESKIIFLQQLGRGLRSAEGKSRLLVIDFVGNHRIFAQRFIHLLSLNGQDGGWTSLKRWLAGDAPQLPDGCLLDVELSVRDMLKEFIPTGAKAGIEAYRALRDELQRRPTATELFGRGYLPSVVSQADGGWFTFIEREGDLANDEREVAARFREWLKTVETTKLNKSYKMVVLRVLLDQGQLFQAAHLPTLSRQCRAYLRNHPILRRELEGEGHAVDHKLASDDEWTAWWTKWPIKRWLDSQNGREWFRLDGDLFTFQHQCPEALRKPLESLTEELVEWRLAVYSRRNVPATDDRGECHFEVKVSHAEGRPILFVPEQTQLPGRPVGPTQVFLPNGVRWEFKFVKVACNVAWPVGEKRNRLGDLLREWFGADAGLPGTDFRVRFTRVDGEWHATPVGSPTVVPTVVPTVLSPTSAMSPVVAVSPVASVSPKGADLAMFGGAQLRIERHIETSARYSTHVPVYDLTVAAGGWGPEGVPEAIGWVRLPEMSVSAGMFVAQVTGRSMEPRIRDGQWCLFRPCPAGSRQNRLLLLQVNTHIAPADGGRYTVKRYYSTKQTSDDGWQHQTIELRPLNPEYSPIQVTADQADDIRVIGEFLPLLE